MEPEYFMADKYLVIGTGALGSVFGGLLQKSGKSVTFIGKGEHFDTVIKNGITINGIWGESKIHDINAYYPEDRSKLKDEVDVILLCVKSNITQNALSPFAHLLKPGGVCVSIQNGLGNVEKISQIVGKQRTIGGRVIFGVEINTPGTATVTVYADKVLLGMPFQENANIVQSVVSDLNQVGIPTDLTQNIMGYIWGKTLYNCALNPLGAILGVTYGELADNQHTAGIMNNIIKEIYAVANTKSIEMNLASHDLYIEFFYKKLVPPTRKHHSSMYQDIKAGRKTEIDALNGKIAHYGKDLGINVYYNQIITEILKFKECGI